jgi:hypothetical protein
MYVHINSEASLKKKKTHCFSVVVLLLVINKLH